MNMSVRSVISIVAAFLCVVASPAWAWERAGYVNYPATAKCLSENMCLLVSCPAVGAPSFEMVIYEHGKATGEPFDIIIDGRTFTFNLPERGAHDLYRWPLADDFSDALQKGSRATLAFDPVGLPYAFSLRGSGAAVRRVLSGCGSSTAPVVAAAAAGGRLSGLSPETDCQVATTPGEVVDLTMKASGQAIEGFQFKDKHGTGYINVDPPGNAKVIQAKLMTIIGPGAKLKIEVHGCGAAASVEVLSAVEVIE
jgi:hypothetical protein